MKTIGIVGGTTWFSSVDYYRYINELVNQRLGGDEAAKIILYSVNYGEIKKLTHENNWGRITEIISSAAGKLAGAGAEVLMLGANTMHHIFDEVEKSVNVPMIHIADATAASILNQDLKTIGLLGTKYTMQLPFFSERLKKFGIETVIPGEQQVEVINATIYNELGKGKFLPETKELYKQIIQELQQQGAEGVILGCTEIPLLIKQTDSRIPVFDTTLLHAKAVVDFALS